MFDLSPLRKGQSREMTRFRRELDDLFNRFFDLDFPALRDWFGEAQLNPRVDVSEAEKEIVISMEIPGVKAEDIDIALEGRMLTIKGEKTKDIEEKRENLRRTERVYGNFARTVELPAEVDGDRVEAIYKKGVLKIKMPKIRSTEAKKISIKSG